MVFVSYLSHCNMRPCAWISFNELSIVSKSKKTIFRHSSTAEQLENQKKKFGDGFTALLSVRCCKKVNEFQIALVLCNSYTYISGRKIYIFSASSTKLYVHKSKNKHSLIKKKKKTLFEYISTYILWSGSFFNPDCDATMSQNVYKKIGIYRTHFYTYTKQWILFYVIQNFTLFVYIIRCSRIAWNTHTHLYPEWNSKYPEWNEAISMYVYLYICIALVLLYTTRNVELGMDVCDTVSQPPHFCHPLLNSIYCYHGYINIAYHVLWMVSIKWTITVGEGGHNK